MKKNIKYWSIILTAAFVMTGCSADFLNRPPEDTVVASDSYGTDAQVMSTTSLLYNRAWYDYITVAAYTLGDFRGGDFISKFDNSGNGWFNTTDGTGEVQDAWQAFYVVIGQSNTAIANINKYTASTVTPSIKQNAIGEARFMRALAYYYLVMNWGAIPIITDNEALLGNPLSVQPNTVTSVWKFICNEMQQAALELPTTPWGTNSASGQSAGGSSGRVTKWSAEGMLARFYLARSGADPGGGQRNQTYLDSAKYYAKDVIMNSGKSLLPSYRSLFLFPYNNNNESLFELQYIYYPKTQNWYTFANAMPSFIGPDNSIMANSDGWGGDKGATFWMLQQYDGFTLSTLPSATADASDTLVLKGATMDQRLKETFMMPGFVYPEITRVLPGLGTQNPFIYPNNTFGSTFDGNIDTQHSSANAKKYIVGTTLDVGAADAMDYPNDIYMMRLAEMYLIYAEAELGNQASTSDATAMQYFNAVHTRAGLPAVTSPLTFDVIFKEDVLEFGLEQMLWYNLVSLHYWNPQKAYDIIGSQYRGFFHITPNKFPDPTSWTFQTDPNQGTGHTLSDYATANDGNFLLPYPANEVTQAPNVKGDPVDYYAQ